MSPRSIAENAAKQIEALRQEVESLTCRALELEARGQLAEAEETWDAANRATNRLMRLKKRMKPNV